MAFKYFVDNNNQTLYYEIQDSGLVKLLYDLVRDDQFEFVEITEDNLYDYFEWTGFIPGEPSKNSFDEFDSIGAYNYLKLKDKYLSRVYTNKCSVAMEFEYTSSVHRDSLITYNENTGEMDVKWGRHDTSYTRDPYTYEVSYLNYVYDNYTDWNVSSYYLICDSIWLYADYCDVDGGVYTYKTDIWDSYSTIKPTLLRSKTTLAFIKE